MNKISYEVISLSPRSHRLLPLIFHTDTISASKRRMLSNWHEEIEILTVLEGEGTLHCDSEDYPMTPGDVMIISSGFIHTITSESIVRYHCMILDTDFCRDAGIDTSRLSFITRARSEELRTQLMAAAESITRFLTEEEGYLAAISRARLLDAIAIIARDYTLPPEERRRVATEGDARIKSAIQYVSDNVTRQITLDEIAAAVGISKYHLSREFRRLTDMTVFDFIILTRLKLARKLLREGYSVSESALSAGFENLSYFSKKFREIQGILPSQYAKEQRKGK